MKTIGRRAAGSVSKADRIDYTFQMLRELAAFAREDRMALLVFLLEMAMEECSQQAEAISGGASPDDGL